MIEAPKKFTVVLVAPDYLKEDQGEYWWYRVKARSKDQALRIARRAAADAYADPEDPTQVIDPVDFALVVLIKGWVKILEIGDSYAPR